MVPLSKGKTEHMAEVSVPTYTVRQGKVAYAVFEVVLSCRDGQEVTAWRRWSDCARFSKKLSDSNPSAPRFPKSPADVLINVMGNARLDGSFLEARRLALEAHLKQVIQVNEAQLLDFLLRAPLPSRGSSEALSDANGTKSATTTPVKPDSGTATPTAATEPVTKKSKASVRSIDFPTTMNGSNHDTNETADDPDWLHQASSELMTSAEIYVPSDGAEGKPVYSKYNKRFAEYRKQFSEYAKQLGGKNIGIRLTSVSAALVAVALVSSAYAPQKPPPVPVPAVLNSTVFFRPFVKKPQPPPPPKIMAANKTSLWTKLFREEPVAKAPVLEPTFPSFNTTAMWTQLFSEATPVDEDATVQAEREVLHFGFGKPDATSPASPKARPAKRSQRVTKKRGQGEKKSGLSKAKARRSKRATKAVPFQFSKHVKSWQNWVGDKVLKPSAGTVDSTSKQVRTVWDKANVRIAHEVESLRNAYRSVTNSIPPLEAYKPARDTGAAGALVGMAMIAAQASGAHIVAAIVVGTATFFAAQGRAEVPGL